MTIWILRFISYGGALPIDGHFRTEEAANTQYMAAAKKKAGEVLVFKDDFGIEVSVAPHSCARVLTNTDASAAFQKAVGEANNEATRLYGEVPQGTMPRGSTIQ